jgi:2-polyprenyl-3-methyl-5-hydroxy-6-metoxy-1,4-benzoquinol methylase
MSGGPPDPAAVLAYFNGQASRYRLRSEGGPWAWLRRREAAALLSLAGDVSGCSALDLGCGAGFYACRLADRGARPVVAVDASPSMARSLEDRRVRTVVADIAEVDLQARFQIIFLAGVLEFLADPQTAMITAARHLSPAGRMLLLAPPDTVAGRLYRAFHRRHGLRIGLFGRGSIHRLATAAGLAVTAERQVHPYATAYRLTSA